VLTDTESQANTAEINSKLENTLSQRIRTPVSLIAHDIKFLNRRLRKGQYFFSDIQNEGILLYNNGRFELAQPKELQAKERKLLAEDDFQYWFGKALKLRKGINLYLNEGDFAEAAFLLHQMTERMFGAILLVFTRYKPSTHDLSKLLKRVASIEPRFLEVFPQGTAEERKKFKLLRAAYVDARYKPSYEINREQLEWLIQRVEILQGMTERFCRIKIDSFD
jgi:HEPN domain-containing protein